MLRRIMMLMSLMAIPALSEADVCHRFGPLLPSTCNVGECFLLTEMPRGWYDCTAPDVWRVWGLPPIDDSVQMANGLTWESKILPDCLGSGNALSYQASTNSFVCTVIPAAVSKLSDQSSTVVTFADVTGLTFPILANTRYSLVCELSYLTAAGNTAIQISLNGPASPTAVRWTVTTAISATAVHNQGQSAYDAAANPGTGNTASVPARLSGTVENGTNAGTLALRMRSEVAGSSVTVQRGSWCLLRPY